jgi:hypothetical protein
MGISLRGVGLGVAAIIATWVIVVVTGSTGFDLHPWEREIILFAAFWLGYLTVERRGWSTPRSFVIVVGGMFAIYAAASFLPSPASVIIAICGGAWGAGGWYYLHRLARKHSADPT